MHNTFKIVVFDVDETLGYFVEFGIFWEALHSFIKYAHEINIIEEKFDLAQDEFNKTLDLYPEFIRPNIYSILNYLKHKMEGRNLKGAMIYTNNQGPKTWVSFIKSYFESKIHYNLFVHIISAFKVNGRQVELCRTTNDKTINDFIRCTKLPTNTQICFLDDTYYPNMNNENVYYIKVKPYTYDLSFETLIHRFIDSEVGKKIITSKEVKDIFINFVTTYARHFQFLYTNKTKEEYEIDKIITKKIMIHLQAFFKKPYTDLIVKNKSKSNSKIYKNKTVRHL